jgi:acetolactate synthase-1/2/3 large subunit
MPIRVRTYDRLRQRINQLAIYEPIVKWSTTIDAKTVRQQVRRAIRTATGAPPGPVHFEFPQSETTRSRDYTAEPPLLPHLITPGPDRADLKPALDMLGRARRPILIAGLGVYWCNASAELVKLAERLGAPVLTTTKCKGMIPEDHPLRAGCVIGGLIERKLVMEADLIIAVGLDAVELQPCPGPTRRQCWRLSSIPSLDAFVPADPEIVGDLKALLAGLAQWASEGTNWGEKAAKTFRQDVRDALNTPSTGLSPQRAMEVARAVLPRNTIATCDAGASRLLVVQKWEAYGPREFLTSNGLGSMGYAVPGALAARIAYPDRPVVAFTGDGGFLMTIMELQTAQRENPLIIAGVRRSGDRPHSREAGDQGHSAARRASWRRRLGEARAFLWRRWRRGRHRAGLEQRAQRRSQVQAHDCYRRAHRCVRLCGAVQCAARAVGAADKLCLILNKCFPPRCSKTLGQGSAHIVRLVMVSTSGSARLL